jgi:hypothetical protein
LSHEAHTAGIVLFTLVESGAHLEFLRHFSATSEIVLPRGSAKKEPVEGQEHSGCIRPIL